MVSFSEAGLEPRDRLRDTMRFLGCGEPPTELDGDKGASWSSRSWNLASIRSEAGTGLRAMLSDRGGGGGSSLVADVGE